jgi:hypothetical protein
MRQIGLTTVVLAVTIALAACRAAAPVTASPTGPEVPSPVAPSATPPSTPSSSATTAPTSTPSPEPGVAREVLDAALATLAEQTLRFAIDVRSADPADARPPVTGTGQASFGQPSQFRFASSGVAGTVPPSEVIYDGQRAFIRGRDVAYLADDTWVVLEVVAGTLGHDAFLRQYGDYSLVLVAPLGVISAQPVGQETLNGRAVRRYVTQADIAAARPHLPDSLLQAYEAQLTKFAAAGVPLTHELEVWVDDEGRIARTRYVQDLVGQDVEAVVITYEFDDYGAPMESEPPPGAEVLTLDEARERYQDSIASPAPS